MKGLFHLTAAAVLIIASAVVLVVPGRSAAAEVSEQIRALLADYLPGHAGTQGYQDASAIEQRWLFEVYENSAFQPLWLTGTGVHPEAMVLVENLLNADQHGLDPAKYGGAEIRALFNRTDPASLARLELVLTAGFLGYSNDLGEGRREARSAYPDLFAEAGNDEFDPRYAMSQLSLSGGLAHYLAGLAPQHRYYRLLKETLAHYRALEARGGWPAVADGPTLHPGDVDPRVASIKKILIRVGDLADQDGGGDLYDQPIVEAVQRFQRRHGLGDDGVIGAQTRAAMNVPVDQRIAQITLNLERWRWHLHEIGDTYVLVNIAGFDLKAVQDGRQVLEIPVIVGQQNHESPIFSDLIRYVEFNPYWNLTPHIARAETLPHLRRDPDYLAARHIRLFSGWGADAVELDPHLINWHEVTPQAMNRYKLRQDPGSWNALGTMKFVFPNKYSVYLHDTPDHDLFSRPGRAFSHGCIRVSDPPALAEFLLGGEANGWDRERVGAIVEKGARQVVSLPKLVPVHLTYLTAWHDGAGVLHFSDDVYGRDARLGQALGIR